MSLQTKDTLHPGGPEQCPFLLASQSPSFSGWQGGWLQVAGPFLLSHPTGLACEAVVSQPQAPRGGASSLELFLQRQEEKHFIWEESKRLLKKQ